MNLGHKTNLKALGQGRKMQFKEKQKNESHPVNYKQELLRY